MRLLKQKKQVGEKTYTNYYLEVGEGDNKRLVPIQVRAIVKADGNICNKSDFAIMSFLAEEIK